jgi:3-deoxy-manno-octulosonate cytidylyltransferase (CMP-KDO synthetase)
LCRGLSLRYDAPSPGCSGATPEDGMPRALGVIPARFASTRFPGKPLAPLAGRTLVEEVWRRAALARSLERLVLATDDARIADAGARFGAEVMLTSPAHASGTDRVAEVLERLGGEFELVLNVQGDEPLLSPTSLDRLVAALASGGADLATLAEPLEDPRDLDDPQVVKVAAAADGRALYFSRAPIPHLRGPGPRRHALLRHQGLYAYTAAALRLLARSAPSPLELDEGLEQLRALELGLVIRVVDSDFRSQGVDTPADLERVARILMEAHG